MSRRFVAQSVKVVPLALRRSCGTFAQSNIFRHASRNSSSSDRPILPLFLHSRNFSQDGDQRTTVPATTSGMGHIWPSPIKVIKNFFITRFILPRIDPDFNLTEFMNGARKAIEVISHLMSKGDYAAMENYVEPIVVASIKDSLKETSLQDQLDLAVVIPDIMVSFPYAIEAFLKNEGQRKIGRIDVLVVCHSMKGWGLTKENTDVVVELQDADAARRRVQFLNYQFSRTYVESEESGWHVTGVHHFKPNLEQ